MKSEKPSPLSPCVPFVLVVPSVSAVPAVPFVGRSPQKLKANSYKKFGSRMATRLPDNGMYIDAKELILENLALIAGFV